MGKIEEAEDARLYRQWEKTRSKTDFQNLYRQMLPAINGASRKAAYNSYVPQAVFKLEAAQQFHTAIERYDPKYGTKLSTFIHSHIEPKLNRVNSTYQNIARIPERAKGQGGVFEINQLRNTEYSLHDRLGRPASDVEIAQEMGFTPENVGRLRNELRKDLSLNSALEDSAITGEEDNDKALEYMLYYDLPPEAQSVYAHVSGLHGNKKITKGNDKVDWAGIAKKLNMTESKVQKIRKTIAKEWKRYNT